MSSEKRGADRETVREVMREIGDQIEIASDLNVARLLAALLLFFLVLLLVIGVLLRRLLLLLLRFALVLFLLLLLINRSMRVSMRLASEVSHGLLDKQKGNQTAEYPQAHNRLRRMIVLMGAVRMRVRVRTFGIVVTVVVQRMRNQVQKRVAEQTTRRQTQQHFQQRLVLDGVAVESVLILNNKTQKKSI